MKENSLEHIVNAWDIKSEPEYRGFRCALCQKNLKKAWHHFLATKTFVTPLHFCHACQKKYKKQTLQPIYQQFQCDLCSKTLSKAYHIWLTDKNTLKEIHLCKDCFVKSS